MLKQSYFEGCFVRSSSKNEAAVRRERAGNFRSAKNEKKKNSEKGGSSWDRARRKGGRIWNKGKGERTEEGKIGEANERTWEGERSSWRCNGNGCTERRNVRLLRTTFELLRANNDIYEKRSCTNSHDEVPIDF